jgi:hypothetical protein
VFQTRSLLAWPSRPRPRVNRRARLSRPCEFGDSFGCPHPGGDEFADPVWVDCSRPATHTVRWLPDPWTPNPTRTVACRHHARVAVEEGVARSAYRFRTV